MEYIKLNNGVDIPILGYGTFQIPSSIAEECVLNALSVGYRMIDTAAAYFNEKEIGRAIKKSKDFKRRNICSNKSLDTRCWL